MNWRLPKLRTPTNTKNALENPGHPDHHHFWYRDTHAEFVPRTCIVEDWMVIHAWAYNSMSGRLYMEEGVKGGVKRQ